MDWWGVGINAGFIPDGCSEEGAEPQGKHFIDQLISTPTVTFGHELWVVTKRIDYGYKPQK